MATSGLRLRGRWLGTGRRGARPERRCSRGPSARGQRPRGICSSWGGARSVTAAGRTAPSTRLLPRLRRCSGDSSQSEGEGRVARNGGRRRRVSGSMVLLGEHAGADATRSTAASSSRLCISWRWARSAHKERLPRDACQVERPLAHGCRRGGHEVLAAQPIQRCDSDRGRILAPNGHRGDISMRRPDRVEAAPATARGILELAATSPALRRRDTRARPARGAARSSAACWDRGTSLVPKQRLEHAPRRDRLFRNERGGASGVTTRPSLYRSHRPPLRPSASFAATRRMPPA